MKILVKSAWGSDDPTKAAFPFLHANGFAETGHQPQIFLLGEAVSVMRNPVAAAIVPAGWPPLREILSDTHTLKIPIHRKGSPFGAKESGAFWRLRAARTEPVYCPTGVFKISLA